MAARKAMYLETTTVPAAQSIAEIVRALVEAGARSVETVYGDAGKPVGLSWSMVMFNRPQYFSLPARVEPVYKILAKQKSRTKPDALRQQAERVAWRQMRAWVDSQVALVQLGMVEFAQVFLPYAQGQQGGPTMWEAFRDVQKRLGAGDKT
jgi:hypothetical protein